jgi:hypothetical protein
MFHNNFKIYQISFEEYNIEVEYWNEVTNKVDYTNITVNKIQLDKLVDLLTNLDFDDNTPRF